uniref:Uncharacterized protein n=1 Tax=Acrobeloides nanus TaxID=290746 RepID=A0A914CKH2_9BILA
MFILTLLMFFNEFTLVNFILCFSDKFDKSSNLGGPTVHSRPNLFIPTLDVDYNEPESEIEDYWSCL